jgi:hypothetical protein
MRPIAGTLRDGLARSGLPLDVTDGEHMADPESLKASDRGRGPRPESRPCRPAARIMRKKSGIGRFRDPAQAGPGASAAPDGTRRCVVRVPTTGPRTVLSAWHSHTVLALGYLIYPLLHHR